MFSGVTSVPLILTVTSRVTVSPTVTSKSFTMISASPTTVFPFSSVPTATFVVSEGLLITMLSFPSAEVILTFSPLIVTVGVSSPSLCTT